MTLLEIHVFGWPETWEAADAKVCPRCGRVLALGRFARMRDGRRGFTCLDCARAGEGA